MNKLFIPYISNRSILWKVSLTVLLSTFFILFFLQPFGDIRHGYTLQGFLRILSYAVTASGIVFVTEYVLGGYYRSSFTISQTRFGPLVWYFIVLLLVTIGIYLCRSMWIGWTNDSWRDLIIVLYRVTIISIIPFSLISLLLSRNSPDNKELEIKLVSNDVNPEYLRINVNNLICLASEENYTDIFLLEKDKVVKKLLRGSLSFFETQLDHPIIRIHRSHLINLQKVHEIKMNSSGGTIQLRGIEKSFKISRKYLTHFQNRWSDFH